MGTNVEDQVTAPWTAEQVDALNAAQVSGRIHPFTCANRTESPHSSELGDLGVLVATEDGWVCNDCGYTQSWAWAAMLAVTQHPGSVEVFVTNSARTSEPVGQRSAQTGQADLPAGTRVLLVRHGQSEWNAVGRWQGQADPPLTSAGVAQAVEAAHTLESLGDFDAVYSSPLLRAAMTAQRISETIGVGPVTMLAGLMERHAGPWQGLTKPEIDAAFPGFRAEGRWAPEAETNEVVVARALAELSAVADGHPGGTVAAVTHDGVICELVRALGGEHTVFANLTARWLHCAPTGDPAQLGSWSLGTVVQLCATPTPAAQH